MLLDLFYELSVPDFGRRTETQVLQETLEELALGEELGFSTAWLVEHHFMPEYSHSAAPDVYLAAASQRTHRLRLGHAVIPLPYTHPIHVAERLATLDILSGGRVEFGFGRGFSPREYKVFGADMRDSRTLTEESLAIIKGAFAEGPLSHHGAHYQLDDLAVHPKPVQRPHPPLWMAAVSPESFELAAHWGVGALAGPFKPWFMVREDIRHYHQSWLAARGDEASQPGHNREVGMTVGILCLEDGKRAHREAREGMTWFYRQLLSQTRPVLEHLYESYEYYRRLGRLRPLLDKALSLTVLEKLGMVVVGDPDHCAERLQALQAAGVDRLLCAVGAGVLPPAVTRESMHLIGQEVLPRVTAVPSAAAGESAGEHGD